MPLKPSAIDSLRVEEERKSRLARELNVGSETQADVVYSHFGLKATAHLILELLPARSKLLARLLQCRFCIKLTGLGESLLDRCLHLRSRSFGVHHDRAVEYALAVIEVSLFHDRLLEVLRHRAENPSVDSGVHVR